jgi:hypothetical protein
MCNKNRIIFFRFRSVLLLSLFREFTNSTPKPIVFIEQKLSCEKLKFLLAFNRVFLCRETTIIYHNKPTSQENTERSERWFCFFYTWTTGVWDDYRPQPKKKKMKFLCAFLTILIVKVLRVARAGTVMISPHSKNHLLVEDSNLFFHLFHFLFFQISIFAAWSDHHRKNQIIYR